MMKHKILSSLFLLITIIQGAPLENEQATLGLEVGYSISEKNKLDFSGYINLYELAVKPFELEFDISTFSIQKYHERYRLSYKILTLCLFRKLASFI